VIIRHFTVCSLLILASGLSTVWALDYKIDFELPAGSERFESADWLAYDLHGLGFYRAPDRASIDSSMAHGGRQSLKIVFPRSSVGPSQGGHQAAILLEPADEYYLSYWLKFDLHFSWGGSEQGGKLPGLAQGKLCSGGSVCDGTNGFTARYMWRTGGAAVLYLYHMDKPHQWGQDFPLVAADGQPLFFEPGQWIHLLQRVRVNSGDRANGEVQVWFNGTEALNLNGLRFVSDNSKIDTFYVSTFHGGNTADWGPVNESHLWLDDIEISTRPIIP